MAKPQKVNYVTQHVEAHKRLAADNVSTIDIAIYDALFFIWNYWKWADKLSIHRQDVMSMAKVGSRNSYTASLKKLHEKGYLIYKPSHNALIGSTVTMLIFEPSTEPSTEPSSSPSTAPSTEQCGEPFNKHLETIETLQTEINTLTNKLSSADAEVAASKDLVQERDTEIESLKIQLEKAKRKVAQKEKELATPHWTPLRAAWVAFYKSKFNDAEPTFNAEAGAGLASILKRLQAQTAADLKTKDKKWDEVYAIHVFTHFLMRAFSDEWRANNFRLGILSSHYDSIVNSNPNGKQSTSKPATGGNVDSQSAVAKIIAGNNFLAGHEQ